MKTTYIYVSPETLRVFQDLFDHRLGMKCREMLQNEASLRLTYIWSAVILAFELIMTVGLYAAHGIFWESLLVLLATAIVSKSYIREYKRKVRRDAESLVKYKNLEQIFLRIWASCRLANVPNSQKLVEELELRLRQTIDFILNLQGDKKKDWSPEIEKVRPFVKDSLALIVRLQLMGSYHIQIEGSQNMDDEELLDARARWLSERLFENPKFRMP